MFTVVCFFILMIGSYLVLNPEFEDGLILKFLIICAIFPAGAFILGQDSRALIYCITASIMSCLFWVSKEFIYAVASTKAYK